MTRFHPSRGSSTTMSLSPRWDRALRDSGGVAATGRGPPPPTRGAADRIGQSRPAAAGDHCSRSGTVTYDGSFAGEEKVSCAPDGLCSM
ncbi:hypothetical protein GCM10009601_24230 [Streptomyces thermospinosisporus]|uniref:Uncharacterized protein n=1 Tax=Streptomyces thermospinosisporus TaxID=161482 RepID=A0ABP4JIG4_9ACTN